MFTKEEKKKKEKEEGRGNNKDALTPVALIIASLLFPSSFSRRLSRGRYPERKPYPGESNPSFPFSVYQVTRARFETTDPIRVTHASPFPPISLAAYAVFLIPRIRVHCLPSGRGGGGRWQDRSGNRYAVQSWTFATVAFVPEASCRGTTRRHPIIMLSTRSEHGNSI